MPLKNGQPHCINHPDTQMLRNEGFSAITKVSKSGDSANFQPDSGIPVVAFFCDACGYLEMYAAQKTGLW